MTCNRKNNKNRATCSSSSSLLLFFTLLLLSSSNQSLALTSDGSLLLAFKYSILSDPLSVLDSWHYTDQTPCSWTGVTCNPTDFTVTGLSLPNNQLLGSIAPDIGLLDHLQHLDLSNNLLNGTLPTTLFNSTHLQYLSLANNVISGELPPLAMPSLTYLNLSDNAFAGAVPDSLGDLNNLTVVSLKSNYFSGALPSGFSSAEVVDLSFNLFNGSLPSELGGSKLQLLNLSNNRLTGEIPTDFGTDLPDDVTINLAVNNFTGQIPPVKALIGQKPEAFDGNPDLCGKPLKDFCVIPSSLSNPPNATSIPPAIAVIPRSITTGSGNSSNISPALPGGDQNGHNGGLQPMTIVGITVADFAGITLLGLGLLYLYKLKKRKQDRNTANKSTTPTPPPPQPPPAGKGGDYVVGGGIGGLKEIHTHQLSLQFDASPSPASVTKTCCCISTRGGGDASSSSETASTSEARTSSESEECDEDGGRDGGGGRGRLVMVDGETEMEMETLLKASAYILGASGSSIVYKAVLQSGAAFAVRRLGDCGGAGGGDRIRRDSFEGQVRAIGKLRHPNLVRVRGFYWGSDEKLIISDYVSNGSLASICGYKKPGSSPNLHFTLEVRLKIARGLARGLIYIHEKKFVHGNLKPSNILLTPEMDPIIGDLGISWIINGNKGGLSGCQFGSKRSSGLLDGPAQDASASSSPFINPSSSSSNSSGPTSPYTAPEMLKNLKPSPKWDVYSFGIVLLEVLTGRVFLERELGQWTPGHGLTEDRYWALRMADPAIRADVHGREEAMAGVFKLGFQCASLAPQKRPSMKEAFLVLERIGFSPSQ